MKPEPSIGTTTQRSTPPNTAHDTRGDRSGVQPLVDEPTRDHSRASSASHSEEVPWSSPDRSTAPEVMPFESDSNAEIHVERSPRQSFPDWYKSAVALAVTRELRSANLATHSLTTGAASRPARNRRDIRRGKWYALAFVCSLFAWAVLLGIGVLLLRGGA